MKFVLMLLGVVLAALGIAVGVISQKDFGVALIGLNLGVAATLLAGGLIVLGLGSVISSLDNVMHKLRLATGPSKTPAAPPSAAAFDNTPPPPPSKTQAGVVAGAGAGALAAGTLAASMQKAGDGVETAIDKVSDAAAKAKETTANVADVAADKVGDAKDQVIDAVANVTDKTDDAADAITDTASDVVDDVSTKTTDAVMAASDEITKIPDDAASTADSAAKDASEEITAVVENVDGEKTADEISAEAATQANEENPSDTEAVDTSADASGDETGDEAIAEEGQLYVVEELVVRNRSARTLSDGTVEAETAEGWMRFENLEHLEEYLDAMES